MKVVYMTYIYISYKKPATCTCTNSIFTYRDEHQ